MDGVEAKDRINTIFWAINISLLSVARYIDILKDRKVFSIVFPNVSFENPKITHTIDDYGEIFTTTKREVSNKTNHDLFKGWQIALGIVGMTSVLEHYLWRRAEELSGRSCKAMGIFYRFKDYTDIHLSKFKDYEDLRKYYEVRHITMHNLGRINQKFKDRTSQQHLEEEPYTFYPSDIFKYRNLIHELIDFIELSSSR